MKHFVTLPVHPTLGSQVLLVDLLGASETAALGTTPGMVLVALHHPGTAPWALATTSFPGQDATLSRIYGYLEELELPLLYRAEAALAVSQLLSPETRSAPPPVRNFSSGDWMAYNGATAFENGEDPVATGIELPAGYRIRDTPGVSLMVLGDATGIQVLLYDENDEPTVWNYDLALSRAREAREWVAVAALFFQNGCVPAGFEKIL